MNWEGTSTKSRGTLVPAREGMETLVNIRCSKWPNSWNKVLTSRWDSVTVSPAEGGWILRQTMPRRGLPGVSGVDGLPVSRVFIHAPARLLLREKISR